MTANLLEEENPKDWTSEQVETLSDILLRIQKDLKKLQRVYCTLPNATKNINIGAQELESGFARIVTVVQKLKAINDNNLSDPAKQLGILMDSDIKDILKKPFNQTEVAQR